MLDRDRGSLGPRPARAVARVRRRSARSRGPRARRRRRTPRTPYGAHRRHHPVLAQLAGPGPDPRPPAPHPLERSALTIKGLTYMPTGATVAALHDLAARDAGRRAQLGLPLHVDARHDVHAAGAALPEPRLGGRRVHAVRRRPRAEPGRRPADHVRHRRPPRPHRVDPRRPVGLRGRPAGADRQRCLRPAAERRVRRRPRLDPAAHRSGASTCRDGSGRSSSRRPQCAIDAWQRARPGHLGGPRQAAALRLVEADGLGGARPGRQAGRDPRRREARRPRGAPRRRRSGRTSSPTG